MRVMRSTSKNAVSYYIIKDYTTEKGKRTSKIVEKLGTHEELLEKLQGEDPYTWAKAYAKQLTEEENKGKVTVIAEYSNVKLIPLEEQRRYNASYLFLQQIYHELGLHEICESIQKKSRFTYNLSSILSRLLYTRILDPASKTSSFETAKTFLEAPDFEHHHLFRALEVLCKEQDFIQAEVYKNSLKVVPRNTKILYYDLTNFFFEIGEEDNLRKYGLSKEHRPNPIVQFGLFLDGSGLPLAFTLEAGNTSEQKTLLPLEQKILEDFNLSKFIVCTDAGLSSEENRLFNTKGERAFVVTQSLKKLKAHLKAWALEPTGWKMKSTGKTYDLREIDEEIHKESLFYKERWIKEKGFEQRLLVTYSPKYKAYQRSIREGQLHRAMESIEKGRSQKAKRSTDPARFIDVTHCTTQGEIAKKEVLSLKEEKIREEEQYDGFYGLCTNLEGDSGEILTILKQRWEIEESFRIMKTELRARPVHLSREDRIRAHFLTCFLSLFLYRILEKKLGEHFTCAEIVKTLRGMDMLEHKGEGWIPAYQRTKLTDALHETFGFRTDTEVVDTKTMKKIFKQTKKVKTIRSF